MNRPGARNALSMALMTALEEALEAVARTFGQGRGDRRRRAGVLRRTRPARGAGADGATHERLFAQCSRLMQAITALRMPVIARVHGVATAAGCQLVATCDLAIATDTARFATPGVNIGLFCSTPMVALSRAVGRKAAMEMLLTGELIPAEQAVRLGLINRAVPEAELDGAVWALARQIASKSRAVVALGKPAFYRQAEMTLADAYAYTAEIMVQNMRERDAAEGIDAFLEKRAPVWA